MSHMFDPDTKCWISRHPPPPFDPQANLGQIILDLLSRNPAKVVQIDRDTRQRMTAHEMRLRATRVALNLTSLGFGKADMAALVCTNSENLTPIALGLMIAAVPFIAMPVGVFADDIEHYMRMVQPKLVICDDNVYKIVREAAGNALQTKPVIFVVECDRLRARKIEELLMGHRNEADFVPQYHGDMRELIGVILCTSGTTGPSKGINVSQAHIGMVLKHTSVIKQASVIKHTSVIENTDVMFSFSPLCWGTGLFALLNSIASETTRVITRRPFNEDLFYDILDQYKLTRVCTDPTHAIFLLSHWRARNADFRCIKSWGLSGSHVTMTLREAIDCRLPNGRAVNSYASSEIGLIAMEMESLSIGAGTRNENSVGVLMPHLSAKVVDDDGIAVGVGEKGELLIQTTLPVMGYYKDEAATRELVDADGWIRTGDIGYLDVDGIVHLIGRKKEVIKYRGYQICPIELEAVIGRIDGVEQVCVVGVPEMDGTSDLPAAVIVKRENNALTEEALVNIVNGQVPDHKRLRGGVYFWSELPLNSTGKVLRRKVKEQLAENVRNNIEDSCISTVEGSG